MVQKKIILALIVVLFVLYLIPVVHGLATHDGAGNITAWDSNCDDIENNINDPSLFSYDGVRANLTANLLINGSVILDCDIYVNSSVDGEFKIEVLSGGNLTIDGQTITALDATKEYDFFIRDGSIALINNSIIEELNDGLKIEDDNDILIQNNVIQNSLSHGIHLSGASGIVINNNTIRFNGGAGVFSDSGFNYTITNNNITSNDNRGVYFIAGVLNTIVNNSITDNGFSDLFFFPIVTASCDITVENNNGSGNRPIGYYNSSTNLQNTVFSELILCNADDSILDNITILGSATKYNNAIYLRLSDNVTIQNSNSSNNNMGLSLADSHNNTLTNNIVNTNGYYGISFFVSNNNIVENNSAQFNWEGCDVAHSNNNNITNNIFDNNTLYGIRVSQTASNNLFINNTATSNTVYDFYAAANFAPLNNIIRNLTIDQVIMSFTQLDVAIKSATAPDDDPAGYTNISKYITVTNNTPDSWSYSNISYTDAEIAGINETTLGIWEYDGANWNLVPGGGVNEAENYAYANITSFSVFGVFGQQLGAPPDTAPSWSYNQTNTSLHNHFCEFSVYWQDDNSLSGYNFSTNNTGIWVDDGLVDMTGIGNWSNVTKRLNATNGIAVCWKIESKDSANHWNNTGELCFVTTNTAPSVASATITPSSPLPTNSLTCNNGSTSDADDDTVTLSYDWYKNNAAQGINSKTLGSGNTSAGQSWKCKITPNDSIESGNTVTSNSVTIRSATTPGNDGPGGGGGGGGGVPPASTLETSTKNIRIDLVGDASETHYVEIGEKVPFKNEDEDHTITVSAITSDSVTLEIYSVPLVLTIIVGETRILDINNDTINDLKITLHEIKESTVHLTIEKISDIGLAATINILGGKWADNKMLIYSLIAIVAVLLCILYFVRKRKKAKVY